MNAQPQLVRLTVTLPHHLHSRLANLRDEHNVSVSSIVELALTAYFSESRSDPRSSGATLRRRRSGALHAAPPTT